MEKKNIFNLTFTALPLKINLCYESTINTSTEIYTNDPIYKLLDNSDIENILKLKEGPGPITKFLYFNRKCVYKILDEKNQNIFFDYDEYNNNLSFYFYLLLLIDDTPEILNYSYDKKYIKKLNKDQDFNNETFKKIISSKIIIQLANKYINDYHNDINEENIKKIINSNLIIIENLIKELDIKINWSKEEICSKKIDELYIEIINALIIGKKFEDHEPIM